MQLFSASKDAGTLRFAALWLANVGDASDELGLHLVRDCSIDALLGALLASDSAAVQRATARAIANLAVTPTTAAALLALPTCDVLVPTLERWLRSDDVRVRLSALRARATLAAVHVNDAKYADGVYLVPDLCFDCVVYSSKCLFKSSIHVRQRRQMLTLTSCSFTVRTLLFFYI